MKSPSAMAVDFRLDTHEEGFMTKRTTYTLVERDWLEILKPRFFPGQTLNDDDLNAIVGWTQQRLRLHGASGGWGVVCGLAVAGDPQRPNRVVVGPGFGFDHKMGLCIVQEFVSAELPRSIGAGCGAAESSPLFPGSTDPVRASDLRVFDAYLTVAEQAQQKALAISIDGRRHCENARLRTSARLLLLPAADPDRPGDPASEFLEGLAQEQPLGALLNGYTDWEKGSRFTRLMNEFVANAQKKWPSLQLPWPTLPTSWGSERLLALEKLSWLTMAVRRVRRCTPGTRDPSIPLARVWTRLVGGEEQVAWIDASARYRRTLGCDHRTFDLRDWIGESLEDAVAAAGSWEIDVVQQPVGDLARPASLKALTKYVEAESKLASTCRPGMQVTAHGYGAPEYKLGKNHAIENEQRVFAWTMSTKQGSALTAG